MSDFGAISSIQSGLGSLQRLQQLAQNSGSLNAQSTQAGGSLLESNFPEYLQAARQSVSVGGPSAADAVGPIGGEFRPEAAASLMGGAAVTTARPASFSDAIETLIQGVDASRKSAGAEVRKVLTGQSDNLHQAMIAMQEGSLAFKMMVEVRNKLTEGLQEVMRMQI